MPTGHCTTALDVAAGRANSLTPAEQLHANCPGILTSPIGTVYCDCPCHEGHEGKISAPAVRPLSQKRTASGRRTRKEIDGWGVELEKSGKVMVSVDENQVAGTKSSLYNTARRHGLKIKVTAEGGLITATVK
jgi:hypothetical protein